MIFVSQKTKEVLKNNFKSDIWFMKTMIFWKNISELIFV